jgi:hypothetical protein
MESSATRDVVSGLTRESVDARVRAGTEQRLLYYVDHPNQIQARLDALEREWDIERALEAHAAALALTGTALGLTVSRKLLLVPGVAAALLLQHAVQGWCPAASLLRRMGVRTRGEIETERDALRILRGDFREVTDDRDAAAAAEPQARVRRALGMATWH